MKIKDLTGRGLKPKAKMGQVLVFDGIQTMEILRVVKDKGCGSGYAVVVKIIRKPSIERFDLPWFDNAEKGAAVSAEVYHKVREG